MCVFNFSPVFFSEKILILKEFSDLWPNVHVGFHVKQPLFFSYFNETWIFSTVFSENILVPNFVKFRPVTATLFDADGGRMDSRDGANSRFSQFCESA